MNSTKARLIFTDDVVIQKLKNFVNTGRTELKTLVSTGDVPLINITTWRINITAKFWTGSIKMITKFFRKISWIDY